MPDRKTRTMTDLTHIAAPPTAPAPSPRAALIGQPGAEHAIDAIAERHRLAAHAGQPEPIRLIFDGPSGTGKSTAAKLLARRIGLPGRRVVLDTHRFTPSDGADLGHVAWRAFDDTVWRAFNGILFIKNCADAHPRLWHALLYHLTSFLDSRRIGVVLDEQPRHDDNDRQRQLDWWRASLDEAGAARLSEADLPPVREWLAKEFTDPPVIFTTMSATAIVDVARAYANKKGYVLSEDAAQVLDDAVTSLTGGQIDHLGNARLGREVTAEAIDYHAARLLPDVAARVELSDSTLSTITAADIVPAIEAVIQPPAHASGISVHTGT